MNQQNITFYPVEKQEDIYVLSTLAKEIWEQHFTPIIGGDQVAYMVDKFLSVPAVTKQLSEGYRYYLIEVDGIPQGFTGIHAENGALFLSKLYLRQSMRGRGIARTAMNFLVDICKAQGLQKIWLTCNRHNDNTLAVYRHMGFETVKEQKADIGGGFYMDDYIMEYQVTE